MKKFTIKSWCDDRKETAKVELEVMGDKINLKIIGSNGEEMDMLIEMDKRVPCVHFFNQHENKESAIHLHKLENGYEVCFEDEDKTEDVQSSFYKMDKAIFYKDTSEEIEQFKMMEGFPFAMKAIGYFIYGYKTYLENEFKEDDSKYIKMSELMLEYEYSYMEYLNTINELSKEILEDE